MLVFVHPLVPLTVSDHITRKPSSKVLGILLGTSKDMRNIEIETCFGITSDESDYSESLSQYKKVFPDLSEVGFYTNDQSLVLGKPGLLLVQTTDIQLFEYQNNKLECVEWQFTATDQERIAVHHLILNENSDSLTSYLGNIQNAIVILNSRVAILAAYVRAVSNEKVPKNHHILRSIYSICNRLPTLSGPTFNRELGVQLDDALLVTYMCVITRGIHTVNNLIEKMPPLDRVWTGGSSRRQR